MKPTSLVNIEFTASTLGFSHVTPSGMRMTYIPLHDHTGQFRGSLYLKAEDVTKSLSLYCSF